MASRAPIRPKDLRFHLLPDGYVGLECVSISPNDNLRLFGDEGDRPPCALTELVDECLELVAAVPDAPDKTALRNMAAGLKSSLAKVETAIAGLPDKAG